jgi:hypothetical protein
LLEAKLDIEIVDPGKETEGAEITARWLRPATILKG